MKKPLVLGLLCLLAGCVKQEPVGTEEYLLEGRSLNEWLRDVKDPNENVRFSAYEHLKTMGPEAKEAVPVLIKALQDEDGNVRWVAADCLGRMGVSAKDAIESLNHSQTDKDPRVQRAAIRALAQIYRAQARPVAPEQ
jgi:HEAT repeat protein